MNHYIVYNPQVDEFVKINKLDGKTLLNKIDSYAEFLSVEATGISDYLRKVVSDFVKDSKKFDMDECLESLFECVVEAYPPLQIELVCKAINEGEEDSEKAERTKTLSQIDKIKSRIAKKLIGQDDAIEECQNAIKLIAFRHSSRASSCP